jgi:hypothetical protein
MVNEDQFTVYTCSIDKDENNKPLVGPGMNTGYTGILISSFFFFSFALKQKTRQMLLYKKIHQLRHGLKY